MGATSVFFASERTTPTYSADLIDSDKNIVKGSELGNLTLTFYEVRTETIINSRNKQDVLQKNNVTVDELGKLKWVLQEADTTILDPTRNPERHKALFEWDFTGPDGKKREGKQEVVVVVTNLVKVP